MQRVVPGPVVLIIRDGWGRGKDTNDNAIARAYTPINDRLLRECHWNLLECSGEAVGLPDGQMGNSEVGHLNLGAGRIVYQDITRISKAVRTGEFFRNDAFVSLVGRVAQNQARIHLIGLCSDGGVHSHIDHLGALISLCGDAGVRVLVHCITDGRDTLPTSGREFIASIQKDLKCMTGSRIATVSGRYYAMDRDKRWDRTEKAYSAMVFGSGEIAGDPVHAIQSYYDDGITDEFLPPTVINSSEEFGGIRPQDGIIFFNFRADRARQMTTALVAKDFPHFERLGFPSENLVTMTQYEDTPTNPVAFPPNRLVNILADVLAEAGCTQLRAAETEKYAHVTYFFNGGRETPVKGEDRCLIPSPKVATYDLKPDMSACELTANLIRLIKEKPYDFVLVNYANPDMVGHTADIPATIKAVETVDKCVGELLEVVQGLTGAALVTSDHGNAEKLRDEHGNQFTAHTLNPVEFVIVTATPITATVRRGILADVAPTVLALLGLKKPQEMTGENLITMDS